MRFRRKKNNLIWYIVIVLFALVSLFIVEREIVSKRKNRFTQNLRNEQEVLANNNSGSDFDQGQAINPTEPVKPNLEDYRIPILMYHHIRDYDDPNDKIGTNLSVAPDIFESQLDIILQKGYSTTSLSNLTANKIPDKSVILTFDDGYLNFFENAYPALKRRNMTAVVFVIANKLGAAGYLNADQIKEMSANGIEIGSHSNSHPDLSKLSTEKLNSEIIESKNTLENLIGKKIISFCYPSGKYSETVKSSVSQAGYDFAVTTKSGVTTFDNNLELNRYRVDKGVHAEYFLK